MNDMIQLFVGTNYQISIVNCKIVNYSCTFTLVLLRCHWKWNWKAHCVFKQSIQI